MTVYRLFALWSAAIFLGIQPASAQTTQPSDPAWLIQRFDTRFLPQVRQTLAQPATNETGAIAWGHSYQLAALVEMIETTRDPKYADLFVQLARLVADARDDQRSRKDEVRNRIVRGWGSVKYSDNKNYVWAVHTGMIVEPMARFNLVVQHNPRLQPDWRAQAVALLQTAIESAAVHDDQFRQGPAPDEGYLFEPFLDKHLPLNQQNALARAWLWLGEATGEARYIDRARRLARFFKNRLRTEPDGSCVWGYWPPLDGPGDHFEDTSHAAINADFMIRCAERNLVFDRADLTRLEKTFLTRVLPGPDAVSDSLRGPEGATGKYPYAPFFWARLARHSLPVRDRLLAYARRRAGDQACSPSEALGLALLVPAAPATAPAATAPATATAASPDPPSASQPAPERPK